MPPAMDLAIDINFPSEGLESVSFTDELSERTWTESGAIECEVVIGTTYTFTCTLKSGYELDTVTAVADDTSAETSITGNTFTVTFPSLGAANVITITTKSSASSPTLSIGGKEVSSMTLEGVEVTKIADSSGNTLWEKKEEKKGYTLEIIAGDFDDSNSITGRMTDSSGKITENTATIVGGGSVGFLEGTDIISFEITASNLERIECRTEGSTTPEIVNGVYSVGTVYTLTSDFTMTIIGDA